MRRTTALHVRFEGTFLCLPLQNNNVKWWSSWYCFREREPQWLIFRMFFWNWTLSVHTKQTMAVHVRYKSLYISLPFSAKQKGEMTKIFCLPGAIIGSPILAPDTTQNTKQNRKKWKSRRLLGRQTTLPELRLGSKKGKEVERGRKYHKKTGRTHTGSRQKSPLTIYDGDGKDAWMTPIKRCVSVLHLFGTT